MIKDLTLENIRHLSLDQCVNLLFKLYDKYIQDQQRLVVCIDLTRPYTALYDIMLCVDGSNLCILHTANLGQSGIHLLND